MKTLESDIELNIVIEKIDACIDRSKLLPSHVFKGEFSKYAFITFDEVFMRLFFNHISNYVAKIEDDRFWCVALNRKSRLFKKMTLGVDGGVEFSRADTEETYLSTLNGFSHEDDISYTLHFSDALIFLSANEKWAIFADRDADIAICAFKDRSLMESFEAAYGADLLNGIEAAAEYAYGAGGGDSLKDQLRSNYSSS